MSDTPKAADDCMKLLDQGYAIVMFKNQLVTYTAVGIPEQERNKVGLDQAIETALFHHRETDDFTPSQALYRLTEKLTTGRIA